jgi:hypothetical protein
MQYSGVLKKMRSEFHSPVQYFMDFENSFLIVNQLLGKNIKIEFSHYQCLNCGLDKKIFRQGHCYDCFQIAPEYCIIF